jgi:hypothetical protein
MTLASTLVQRSNLWVVGAHALLLVGAVGMLFLQRYIWLVRIAEQGYGPYQTVSQVTGISAFFIAIDLIVLWATRGDRRARIVSLLWPTFFFGGAALILVANN